MRQRGFSLLEILVAFTILAMSLGLLMQIFSGSLGNASVARDQAQATTLARSLLAGMGLETTLAPTQATGSVADKFQWRVEVSPFIQAPRQGELESQHPRAALDLWQIDVQVAWGGESKGPARTVTMSTLRLQPATAQ
jgi:general secretion pathway protein I